MHQQPMPGGDTLAVSAAISMTRLLTQVETQLMIVASEAKDAETRDRLLSVVGHIRDTLGWKGYGSW